jgi:hypothetical protein
MFLEFKESGERKQYLKKSHKKSKIFPIYQSICVFAIPVAVVDCCCPPADLLPTPE